MAVPEVKGVPGLYPKRYFHYRDDQEAQEAEEELIAKLALNEQWEDPEFPASGKSLYHDPHDPPRGALPDFAFDWLRINGLEVLGMSDPKTFGLGEAGMTKGELVQGALGDRWLLSAMSILAVNPRLLAPLFVSERHKDKGIYTLKLFKAGQWRYVHIDDRIPCSKAGKPYFARSRDVNEAWPMLLEKAYAKVHGCYEAVSGGGRVEEGLKDLMDGGLLKLQLGRTTVSTELPVESGGRSNSVLLGANKPLPSSGLSSGNLFDLITRVLATGGQVAASLEHIPPEYDSSRPQGSSSKASSSQQQAPKKSAQGLLAQSVYVVQEARRFYAEPTEDRDGQHVFLLKVRNPWCEGHVFKGPWSSANDPRWAPYPKIKADFFPAPKPAASSAKQPLPPPPDPYTFYMTFADFIANFNTVYTVLGPNEDGVRYTYHGRWLPGDPKSDAGGSPLYPTFPKNPQYAFQLTDASTTLVINLSQHDSRWQAPQPPLKKLESMAGFFVVKLHGLKRRQSRFHSSKVVAKAPVFHNARCVTGVVTLPPGRYAVIPCTYVPTPEMERFVLEVYCDKKADAEQLDGAPADTDDRESDDEGLEEEKLTDKTFPRVSEEPPAEDASERVYQSLQLQVADLSRYIFTLKQHVEGLEAAVLGSSSSDVTVASSSHFSVQS